MFTITFDEIAYPILCGFCGAPVTGGIAEGLESAKAGCVPCGNLSDLEDVVEIARDSIKGRAQARIDKFYAGLFARNVPELADKAARKVAGHERHRFVVEPPKI